MTREEFLDKAHDIASVKGGVPLVTKDDFELVEVLITLGCDGDTYKQVTLRYDPDTETMRTLE